VDLFLIDNGFDNDVSGHSSYITPGLKQGTSNTETVTKYSGKKTAMAQKDKQSVLGDDMDMVSQAKSQKQGKVKRTSNRKTKDSPGATTSSLKMEEVNKTTSQSMVSSVDALPSSPISSDVVDRRIQVSNRDSELYVNLTSGNRNSGKQMKKTHIHI